MTLRTLETTGELSGKRALVRVDFNVPMKDGHVTDDTRLRAALPTIKALCARGAKLGLLAHFGRPRGMRDLSMSLRPVIVPLSELLRRPVVLADDCVGPDAQAAIDGIGTGGIVLLENVRFHPGEEANDAAFARALAANGDLYVNDAFSVAHRAHASTEGIAHVLPAYSGLAMQRELEELEHVLGKPPRPVLGIVGGAKISTKIDLLRTLVTKFDRLAIGGGIANTFLFSAGWNVGTSVNEPELAQTAREITSLASENGCKLLLPVDVVVGGSPMTDASVIVREFGEVRDGERILDSGPRTIGLLRQALKKSRTLVWNGPIGMFETPPFDRGTIVIARTATDLTRGGKLVSIAGGGDTVAALNQAGVTEEFTLVSTAGGAFLEWVAGKTLPGVAALKY